MNENSLLVLLAGPSTSSSGEIIEDDCLIEALIMEVQQRPPLFDIRLPLKERTPERKAMLWREVYLALDGKIPEAELPSKFKSLRDRYVREKNVHPPSGSGAVKRKKWVHFDSLTYLNSCIKYKKTSCSLDEGNGARLTPTVGSGAVPLSSPSPKSSQRGEFTERILQELRDTKPKENDGIHHFCMAVADLLRQKKREDLVALQIQILEILK
ncbi:uncharacterized protein LOC124159788 [Ischnura elegans]|uniref:uncharacterized protein LOC124159788 n=1 Tax=Ischnura elegans TaxID=197161 RepID=UPI001ED8983D|nr:uncharacterized protein LOC124159788 [Ischnura elegans]